MSVVRLVAKPAPPATPKGLPKAAREEWARLAPILRERGTLTAANEPLLTAYVGALALISEIDRELSKRGTKLVITGTGGVPRPHPLIGARNRASQNALQFAKRLGIVGGAPAGGGNKGGEEDQLLESLLHHHL